MSIYHECPEDEAIYMDRVDVWVSRDQTEEKELLKAKPESAELHQQQPTPRFLAISSVFCCLKDSWIRSRTVDRHSAILKH